MTTIETESQMRLCERCLAEKPLSQFRRRIPNTNKRPRVCNSCHARNERERRRAAKLHGQDRILGLLACRLRTADTHAVVERLVDRTMAQFGSVQEFVESFMAHFQRLGSEKPLSKTLCNYYLAMLKLLLYMEQQPPPDTSDMTDDEPTDCVLADFLRRADTDTDAIVALFERHGWTVTPPAN